ASNSTAEGAPVALASLVPTRSILPPSGSRALALALAGATPAAMSNLGGPRSSSTPTSSVPQASPRRAIRHQLGELDCLRGVVAGKAAGLPSAKGGGRVGSQRRRRGHIGGAVHRHGGQRHSSGVVGRLR